jgi:hypothetical protein
MNIGAFRKTFLLSGIFLLSVFVVSQPSWGCDDCDKWNCDHHDRWDCDQNYKHCCPPKIQIVYVDFDEILIYFTIYGKNFDNGGPPAVTLGGLFDLKVESYSENRIEATLPLTDKFEYGDYKLVVSTGHGSKCKDKDCTDHGNKCDDKYWTGSSSKCKDKYCIDQSYKCEDKYCLTVSPVGAKGPEGPPGPQGPPGISNLEYYTTYYDKVPYGPAVLMEARCSTSTKKLLGGGGGIKGVLGIYDPKPVMIYNGPNADGSAWNIIWFNDYEAGIDVKIEVYAICADVSQ